MSIWNSIGAIGAGSQNMHQTTINGGTGITLANTSNSKTTFSGKVHMDNGAVVNGIDVGESLKLLTFFLQSRHPEVFEEFNAIEKIKES